MLACIHFKKLSQNLLVFEMLLTVTTFILWRLSFLRMRIIVDEQKLELIQHPLCQAIILYGRQFYYFQLGYYFLFLSTLTLYILTSLSPVETHDIFNCSAIFHEDASPNMTLPRIVENNGLREQFQFDISYCLVLHQSLPVLLKSLKLAASKSLQDRLKLPASKLF